MVTVTIWAFKSASLALIFRVGFGASRTHVFFGTLSFHVAEFLTLEASHWQGDIRLHIYGLVEDVHLMFRGGGIEGDDNRVCRFSSISENPRHL